MTTKTCSKCGETKDVSEFTSKHNIVTQPCKYCQALRMWLKRNPDKSNADFQYSPYKNKPQAIKNGMMKCTQCNKHKDLIDFYPPMNKNNIPPQPCRKCHADNQQKYRNDLKEGKRTLPIIQMLEQDKATETEINKYLCAKQMLKHAQSNTADRECTITLGHIIIPDYCPALGIKLYFNNGYENIDTSPALDRIDNNIGYVPGNIVVVSHRANRIKFTTLLSEINKRRILLDATHKLSRKDYERKKVFDFYSMLWSIKNIDPLNMVQVMSIEDQIE